MKIEPLGFRGAVERFRRLLAGWVVSARVGGVREGQRRAVHIEDDELRNLQTVAARVAHLRRAESYEFHSIPFRGNRATSTEHAGKVLCGEGMARAILPVHPDLAERRAAREAHEIILGEWRAGSSLSVSLRSFRKAWSRQARRVAGSSRSCPQQA